MMARLAVLVALLSLVAGGGCLLLVAGLAWVGGWLPAPLNNILPLAGLLGAALAALAFFFRRLAGPLRDLMNAANRIEAGDLDVRVEVRGPREIRWLAMAFNRMSYRLAQTEQQRRQLLADITHELQTPLTVLQGNLEALTDGLYPADGEHLEPLLAETQLLARLVSDIATLSDVESGTLQLHREPCHLPALAQEILQFYSPQAQQRGVALSFSVPADLPTAEADPQRVKQILSNLLSNALRHTPAGGTVRLELEAANPGWIQLRVGDSGGGIAPEDLNRVFDRAFKSADSSGRGLGLTIARSLVEAHGGEIAAESEPGVGTTIRFTLPQEKEE